MDIDRILSSSRTEERTIRNKIFWGVNDREQEEIKERLRGYGILEDMKYLLSLEDKHNLSLVRSWKPDIYLVHVNNYSTNRFFSEKQFLRFQENNQWEFNNEEHSKIKDYFDYLEIAKRYPEFLGL